MPYTISSLYTIKKHYLSNVGTVFHFTRISLYTIYSERQKSCKVRATCTYIALAEGNSFSQDPLGPISFISDIYFRNDNLGISSLKL